MGRIAVWHPSHLRWSRGGSFCASNNTLGWGCFFKPLSNCTLPPTGLPFSPDSNRIAPSFYHPSRHKHAAEGVEYKAAEPTQTGPYCTRRCPNATDASPVVLLGMGDSGDLKSR